ncbi:hypothetical protein CF319_g6692 [Tilletia indica]|nr:hypothetical protein CF319_g6692 [Tilletia indica]
MTKIEGRADAPLTAQLRSVLDEYEETTLALFAAIENGTAFDPSNQKQQQQQQQQPEQQQVFNTNISSLLNTLHSLDEHLQVTLLHTLLPTHTAQQHTIDALVQVQRTRDQGRKEEIERLSQMKAELDSLVRRGREEKKEADRAEAEPLSYKHILNYASYLSRVTSAPPGHRPPGFGVGIKEDPSTDPQQQQQQQQQPQMDWPFPSEAQMRRGALAAAAAARTDELLRPAETSATEEGATAVAAAAGLDVQHAPQNFPLPGQSHHQHAQHHHHHHQQQQVEMEEDAFDLDLN